MQKPTTNGIALLVILLIATTFILASLTTEYWTEGKYRTGLWISCNSNSTSCWTNVGDKAWLTWMQAAAGLSTASACLGGIGLILIILYNFIPRCRTKFILVACGVACLLAGIVQLVAVILWGVRVQSMKESKNEFGFALAAVHAVVMVWAAIVCFFESSKLHYGGWNVNSK